MNPQFSLSAGGPLFNRSPKTLDTGTHPGNSGVPTNNPTMPWQFRPVDLFCKRFPNGLPGSYLVVDVHSSGLEDSDLILGIGHAWVQDGRLGSNGIQFLDWCRRPYFVDPAWLEGRLAKVPSDRRIALKTLSEEGDDPLEVLTSWRYEFLQLPPGIPLVGHGVFNFDFPLLQRHFAQGFGDHDFDFMTVPFFDVGLLEKAITGDIFPWEDESNSEFQARVTKFHIRGARWALDHCLARYGIHDLSRGDPLFGVYAADAIYRAHHQLICRYWQGMQPMA